MIPAIHKKTVTNGKREERLYDNATNFEIISDFSKECVCGDQHNMDNESCSAHIKDKTKSYNKRIHNSRFNVTDVVTHFENTSEKKEKMMITIDDIAVEAHLLELNVTIESLRSGNNDRSLCGVLDEVRKLAKKSAEAAKAAKEMVFESKLHDDINPEIDVTPHPPDKKQNIKPSTEKNVQEYSTMGEDLFLQAALLQNMLEKSNNLSDTSVDEKSSFNCYYLSHNQKNGYSAKNADRKGLEIAFQ